MSNRHANYRSYANPQKMFVRKDLNSAPREPSTTAHPTLSSSLRQSLPQQSRNGTTSSSSSSAATSARRVESGDGVSGGDQGGNFVNYLPQDEAVAVGLGADEGGLDPVESQRVVDSLNRELSRLLKLNPRDFWKEVARDASLHDFLDSFLQFRSRWYDFPYRGAKGIVAGVIIGESDLCRRVFMVLFRISSNRAPGMHAADSLNLKDHAVLLQEKKLLDLPKLLDICAIYGHENQDLTRLLVLNSLKSQPGVHDDLSAVYCHFYSISHTMHQRCSSSVEALSSPEVYNKRRSDQLLADFLEVMDFINDAVVSLDAFVSAYKPAAVVFSCPIEASYGNEELLSALARLHDSLLPSLQQGFQLMLAEKKLQVSNDILTDAALSLKMLSLRIVEFGRKLLEICYLSDEVFDGSFTLPDATNMFPASIEDPVIRADILVQTFKDLNGFAHLGLNQWATFLQHLEIDCGIMSRIHSLRDTGWILMDDEQVQYLHSIMAHPLKTNGGKSATIPITTNKAEADEDAAIVESKISQIRELFPEYGKGFVLACLEVYNQNPEEVIQRILEGTLHEDLQSLDTSVEEIPQPIASSSIGKRDKGKGKVSEFTVLPATSGGDAARNQATEAPPSLSSTVGRFIRKPRNDVPDSKILDSRDVRDAEKTAALAAKLEYEDEYDDSFDDLGLSVGELGLEETEILGDRISSSSPLESDSSSKQNPSNSKWNSRKKPQFYVKDGKNYSYKVAGSVAVANQTEASVVNQAQKDSIHGLGRGGNLPLGAVQRLTELNGERGDDSDPTESAGRGNRGSGRGRGRGGGRNNYRKDQAFKKHISGLGGY